MPDELLATNKVISFPSNVNSVLDNILIFGLQGNKVRIVPPAWSLDVELNWYLILFVLSFFGLKFRKLFLMISTAMVVLFIYPVKVKFYGSILGSGFAFSLGAIHYYYQPKFNKYISSLSALSIAPVMYIVPHLLATTGAGNNDVLPYNFLIMIGFVILVFVSFQIFIDSKASNSEGNKLSSESFSQLLGALSYPMFLTHWYASALTLYFFDVKKNTIENLLGTFVIAIILAYVIVIMVERPVSKYRRSIRHNKI